MSLVEPSPMKPGDDLDGLLRTFFRSQMPQPWPAFQAPRSLSVPAARPASSGHPLMRSRYALAASVALLLLGSLFLPSRFTQTSKFDGNPGGALISDTHEQQRMKRELKDKHFENKHKPGLGADEGDGLHDFDEFGLSPIK